MDAQELINALVNNVSISSSQNSYEGEDDWSDISSFIGISNNIN